MGARTGVATVAVAIGVLAAPASAAPLEVDKAIVFCLDVSLSMDADELHIAREGLAEAFGTESVVKVIAGGAHGRIAATYVEFAGSAAQVVGWTVIDGKDSAAAFAEAVSAVDGPTQPDTDISSALFLAGDLFDTMPYTTQSMVVDIVGDGIDGSRHWLAATREALIARGVVINGMPLVIDPSQPDVAAFYRKSVVGGPGHFSMPVTRIGEMPEALRRKIVLELY